MKGFEPTIYIMYKHYQLRWMLILLQSVQVKL